MSSSKTEKPWGFEILWAKTSDYVGKILYIENNKRLSLQYHEIKDETVYVLSGKLTIIYGDDTLSLFSIELNEGECFHIKPRMIHRFCANHGDVKLVEVSTTEIDDVVRLEDDYKRV